MLLLTLLLPACLPACAANPLVNRTDVICTPHLGASTQEAQEGVAIEVVEAVVDALNGKLSSNAVNAPMVPAEILKELQPYITLAEGLGKAAVGLVSEGGFSDISITYSSPRGDDLDTRLLRAMIIKGCLESTTTSKVNLVNADLLAKQRGIKITEVTVRSDGRDVLTSMSVALSTARSKFSAAVDKTGRIYVEGKVQSNMPLLTKIGNFDVELSVQVGMEAWERRGWVRREEGAAAGMASWKRGVVGRHGDALAWAACLLAYAKLVCTDVLMLVEVHMPRWPSRAKVIPPTHATYPPSIACVLQPAGRAPSIHRLCTVPSPLQGSVLLTRQRDQPGIVGGVGMLLAKEGVNISFMTVSRTGKDGEAIMAIGVDSEPSKTLLDEINSIKGVVECTIFKEM